MKGIQKAAALYKLLGDSLPLTAFQNLSDQELEKLLGQIEKMGNPTVAEERVVLVELKNYLSRSSRPSSSPRSYSFSSPVESPSRDLPKKTAKELQTILQDESPQSMARVLSFASPQAAAQYLSTLPKNLQEEVLLSIAQVDFHSKRERSELDRFLKFRTGLLAEQSSLAKVKDPKGKKAGELLTLMAEPETRDLLQRIQRKSPSFAENIQEHYYRMEDLLKMGRPKLTQFLSEIHPLVIACALKGLEHEVREKIFKLCETWLVKDIQQESDILGPISLAEMEAAQKGILDRLSEEVEFGRLKLWRDQ